MRGTEKQSWHAKQVFFWWTKFGHSLFRYPFIANMTKYSKVSICNWFYHVLSSYQLLTGFFAQNWNLKIWTQVGQQPWVSLETTLWGRRGHGLFGNWAKDRVFPHWWSTRDWYQISSYISRFVLKPSASSAPNFPPCLYGKCFPFSGDTPNVWENGIILGSQPSDFSHLDHVLQLHVRVIRWNLLPRDENKWQGTKCWIWQEYWRLYHSISKYSVTNRQWRWLRFESFS